MSIKYVLLCGSARTGKTESMRRLFPHEFFWRNDPFRYSRPCWQEPKGIYISIDEAVRLYPHQYLGD